MRVTRLGVAMGVAAAVVAGSPAVGAISITAFNTPYTQDFNTLGTGANTTHSGGVPDGWAFAETGTAADTTYQAGVGSSGTGNTWSFGATINASDTERAFGTIQSASAVPTIGASFTNLTGVSITELAIDYDGETWRVGAANRVDRLDFQYSLDATSLTSGTWVDVDTLDFIAVPDATTGAKAGNANKQDLSGSIASLNIADGSSFWIRWSDLNASGSDDGQGIDNFSITAVPVPEPGMLALAGPGLLAMLRRRR